MKRKLSQSRRLRHKHTPNWLELPLDVTASIRHRVGAIDILENVQKVCTTWRRICKDPAMWGVIDMRNLGDLFDMPYDLEKIASQLRRLRVVICHELLTESLNIVVKKLPLLEEFHLYYTYIDFEAIENIGCCCPLLKSFIYNQEGHTFSQVENDEEALAIAKNMPGLRQLHLFGNKMTNIGLQAILDGCPHLDSLDLRQCFHVKLEGDLGKRCSKIKDLKRPFDSTKGYGFVTSPQNMMYSANGIFEEIFEDFW
ncbi:unnamed protein product [Ilex paraguariensis]|uniref:F-box domain-containing protein n=1 Tax=Ilex paraguariensis TaxID=185542 RepID=A0ABC8RCZ3_9AQUA